MDKPSSSARKSTRVKSRPYEFANEYSYALYSMTKGFNKKRVDNYFKKQMRDILGRDVVNRGLEDESITLPSNQRHRRPSHPLFHFKPEWLKEPTTTQKWSRQIVDGLLEDEWLQERVSETLADKKEELDAFIQDTPLIEKYMEQEEEEDMTTPEELVTNMEASYLKPLVAKVLLDAITEEKEYLTTLYSRVSNIMAGNRRRPHKPPVVTAEKDDSDEIVE